MALRRRWLVYRRHNVPGVVAAGRWSSYPTASAPACVPGNNLTKSGLVRSDTSVGESWSMAAGLQTSQRRQKTTDVPE